MIFNEIVKEEIKSKKLDWNNNPDIGDIKNSKTVSLYYGTYTKDVKNIFREGIYAGKDGYVLCALEPYTAIAYAAMSDSLKESAVPLQDRIIFKINIPRRFVSNNIVVNNNNGDYKDWGKSDVEYYALNEVRISNHIPVEFIEGYMIKNDC